MTSRRTDRGARLIDLAIDPTSHAVTEADSPLALAELPPRWVAGIERFLVSDVSHAWTVDADRPDLARTLERLGAAGCRQITSNDPAVLAPMIQEIAACS